MITSFIIHYLGLARPQEASPEGMKQPVGHLIEKATTRSSNLLPNGIP
jgi:hypothetical protein